MVSGSMMKKLTHLTLFMTSWALACTYLVKNVDVPIYRVLTATLEVIRA